MSKAVVVKELRLWNEFENYEIGSVVGTGGWGKVYSALRRSDQKVVALKFFGYSFQSPVMSSINSEVMLMMSLIGVHGIPSIISPLSPPFALSFRLTTAAFYLFTIRSLSPLSVSCQVLFKWNLFSTIHLQALSKGRISKACSPIPSL
jgi:serine/threonine protein kinase